MLKQRPVLCGFVLFVFLFQTTGCAWVMHGTKQEVEITAEPSDGVSATLNGKKIKVPKTVKLDRNKDYRIKAKRPGCEAIDEKLEPKFGTTGAWIDIIGILAVGAGLIFLAIDWAVGAVYKFESSDVTLAFECAGAGIEVPGPSYSTPPPAPAPKKSKKKAVEEEEEEDE